VTLNFKRFDKTGKLPIPNNERCKKYYQEHKEKVKALHLEWRKKNREKTNGYNSLAYYQKRFDQRYDRWVKSWGKVSVKQYLS